MPGAPTAGAWSAATPRPPTTTIRRWATPSPTPCIETLPRPGLAAGRPCADPLAPTDQTPAAEAAARTVDDPGWRLHRRRPPRRPGRRPLAGSVSWPRRQRRQPLRHLDRPRLQESRLAAGPAPFPRLFRRTEPPPARLPLRRLRRNRLDSAPPARRQR